jgi:hypothetical protein
MINLVGATPKMAENPFEPGVDIHFQMIDGMARYHYDGDFT